MNIKGLGVAMVTPFDSDLNVDYNALAALTEDLVSNGVDFLVVMGTTGESVTLTEEEKKNCLKVVISANSGRVPVVYGMGGNNTAALCNELRTFDFTGVSWILSASPGYNKPTQEGIFRHYEAIGKASPLPIILYNVPGRTASNVEAETCIRIANEVPKVRAVKEASGDMNQINSIINNAPSGFQVFSGDDALTIPVMKAGGEGVISVIGNAIPGFYSELVNHCLSTNYTEAEELNVHAQAIITLLFKEGNPAGVKALMESQGKTTDGVRLPLVPVSNELKMQLIEAHKEISATA